MIGLYSQGVGILEYSDYSPIIVGKSDKNLQKMYKIMINSTNCNNSGLSDLFLFAIVSMSSF